MNGTAAPLSPGSLALVTGGGGFLGMAIVRQLLARGARARSFSRGRYPELEALGVETVRGDVADARAIRAACRGCDLAFHAAAKAGIWGGREEFHRTNVAGTRNVIEACRAEGVARLIYTSSPSAVFDGRDMEGADESAPYPEQFHAHYPRTKAEAEKAVLAANSAALATVALRPHLIWGPGDPNLAPRLIALARSGRLRIVGSGRNRVDTIYVDNAAEAHVQAAERLAPGSALAGRAYFIAQGEPMPLWEMVNRILAAAGLAPVTRRIPASAAYAAGAIFEILYGALGLRAEPPMTRFVARELATSHWFDLTAARRDWGFDPKISVEDGLRRLADWYRRNGAA